MFLTRRRGFQVISDKQVPKDLKYFETINKVIAAGIYLYIFFMFLSKGTGVRNILVYGCFSLWVITLKYRKNLRILKEPVSIFFWIFIAMNITSTFFSIDVAYSLNRLSKDPLMILLLYPVISTVMSDEARLIRSIYWMLAAAFFIVAVGYYSYFINDLQVLKPDLPVMNTWHNIFARYLNSLMPFIFILFFYWKRLELKILLVFFLLLSTSALLLSTSRGGYLGLLSMILFWIYFLRKYKKYDLKKGIAILGTAIFLMSVFLWILSPELRMRVSGIGKDLKTFNQRTDAWLPAISAFKQRPVFGWGYGRDIFYKNEPFENTPYKQAPGLGPHNTFLMFLFHQGIIGFTVYVLLLSSAFISFYAELKKTSGIPRYILAACLSVLIGNYLFHSMVEVLRLRELVIILGFGMAAKNIIVRHRHISDSEDKKTEFPFFRRVHSSITDRSGTIL
jgi:O-antigen ligase